MGDVRRIELKQDEIAGKKIYRVIKLTNSTDYSIGQELEEQTVKDLCNFTTWEVTIK